MTQFYPFIPNATGPFQFQPTLDGEVYTGFVTWNLEGQRWFLSIYALTGERIFTLPLIGSPSGLQTTDVSWDEDRGVVVVTLATRHGYRLGSKATLALSGLTPDLYNGVHEMVVETRTSLSYRQVMSPGDPANIQGLCGPDIDIAGGYFQSRIVYRADSGNIEVYP